MAESLSAFIVDSPEWIRSRNAWRQYFEELLAPLMPLVTQLALPITARSRTIKVVDDVIEPGHLFSMVPTQEMMVCRARSRNGRLHVGRGIGEVAATAAPAGSELVMIAVVSPDYSPSKRKTAE